MSPCEACVGMDYGHYETIDLYVFFIDRVRMLIQLLSTVYPTDILVLLARLINCLEMNKHTHNSSVVHHEVNKYLVHHPFTIKPFVFG